MSVFDRFVTMKADKPPRVLIYGPPGMGKTTLASEFPNPVFIQAEDGTPAGVELTGFKPTTFEEILEAIGDLYNEDHNFKTLVVDSLDEMQYLLWNSVCRENNWKSIETPGYQRGYVETEYKWHDFLDGLNALRAEKKMNIVLIAHSAVGRFDDPTSASYSQYQVLMHNSGRKLVEHQMDAILLLKQEVATKEEDQGFNKKRTRAESGSARFIYCEARPAFVAKNRFKIPSKIPFKPGEGYAALAKYFPCQPDAAKEAA